MSARQHDLRATQRRIEQVLGSDRLPPAITPLTEPGTVLDDEASERAYIGRVSEADLDARQREREEAARFFDAELTHPWLLAVYAFAFAAAVAASAVWPWPWGFGGIAP